jgi:hypothetical protein
MWSRLTCVNASESPVGQGFSARTLWLSLSVICGWIFGQAELFGQEGQSLLPIPASHSPSEVANHILQQSLLQSVWGPPVHCVVRQSVQVFGKQTSGVGDFVRAGQGSGKLKFHLRMPAGKQLNSLLQVSDGQRLLAIESIGEHKRRTEVDLGKVRPRLVLTNESLRDPVVAMYLAIGGQAESLRKIYQQYEWTSVRDGRLGETDVWYVSGRVTQQPPLRHALAEVDLRLRDVNSSGLLPTKIQLIIGRENAAIPFWLYQVDQVRSENELEPTGRRTSMRITTEWAEPVVLDPQRLTSELFEPPYSNEPLFDQTDRYLPPTSQVAKTSAVLVR